MAHYQVKIAYDGTQFFGFQRQGSARTVQSEFETALLELKWQGKSILCAGRTDTGVHASGQVVSFHLDWKHGCETLQKALNVKLPKDIAVNEVSVVEEGFHPRYDAKFRSYRYRIYCQAGRNPLRDRFAWRVWPSVDLDLLQLAAASIIGTHDFSAFGKAPQIGGHTVRTVLKTEWLKSDDDQFDFMIQANAFLYHMVRRLVFVQVKIGQKLWEIEEFVSGIENQSEQLPGLAKPNGLTLVEVQY
ncbi:MAG: tRNA pseudouridine(38-40) synthase TruA [Chloroflexi bacterium 44-23]|nr:MAG: tRNA pseudouridine(38-40) synthase TruA [Chloroflexi bacterium 44-23]